MAECFDSLANQYQTLGRLFRGALEHPSQKVVDTANSNQSNDTPKPVKRKRKERDPNAPPRPLSGYLLFCQEVRENMSPEELSLNKGTSMMYLTGSRWRALSDSEKQKYINLAESETKKYKESLARYRAQLDHSEEAESHNEDPEPAPLVSAEIVDESASTLKKSKESTPKKLNVTIPDLITPPDEPTIPEPTPEVTEASKPVDVKPEASRAKNDENSEVTKAKIGKNSETSKVKTGKKKKSSKAPVATEHVIEPTVPEPAIEPVVEPQPVTVAPPEEHAGKKKSKKTKKKSKSNGVATTKIDDSLLS